MTELTSARLNGVNEALEWVLTAEWKPNTDDGVGFTFGRFSVGIHRVNDQLVYALYRPGVLEPTFHPDAEDLRRAADNLGLPVIEREMTT